jgi:hypothetical protein
MNISIDKPKEVEVPGSAPADLSTNHLLAFFNIGTIENKSSYDQMTKRMKKIT